MNILAIGGTGFIGRPIVDRLLRAGHRVSLVHRGNTCPMLPSGAQHILAHRDRLIEVRDDIARFEPDVVLDMIAFTEAHAASLVRTLSGASCRIVVASSADVYRNYEGFVGRPTAPPDAGPLAENAPLRETRYPYRGKGLPFEHADDYEKILVEQVVLEWRHGAAALRLPAVYGHGDRNFRLRPYLQRMEAGRPVIVLGDEQSRWRWTRGDVGNVAAAIAHIVADPRSRGVYNVGAARTPAERGWVDEIGTAAGWRGRVIAVPTDRLPPHLRQPFDWRYHLHTSTVRIREQLGYREPVSPTEAWRDALAWERAHLSEAERPDYAAEDALLDTIRGSAG